MLLSLLLPALGKAKQTAQAGACMNNHRQLALAWQLYTEEHQGLLPHTVDDGDALPFTNWVAGNMRIPEESTNDALLVHADRSLLAPFAPHPKSYKCPSDTSPFVRSVSMNNRMNPVRFLKPALVLGGWGSN